MAVTALMSAHHMGSGRAAWARTDTSASQSNGGSGCGRGPVDDDGVFGGAVDGDQVGYGLGMPLGNKPRDRAAHEMPDQRVAWRTENLRQPGHVVAHQFERVRAGSVAVAETAQIDGVDAVAAGKRRCHRVSAYWLMCATGYCRTSPRRVAALCRATVSSLWQRR